MFAIYFPYNKFVLFFATKIGIFLRI